MSDFLIEPVGGGSYDAVLAETDQGLDLVLVGEDATTHPQAVLQRVTYALLTWLGESRFDRSVGFPYEQAVFGVQPVDGIPVLFQQRALAVEGVEGLANYPGLLYDPQTRRLVIEPLQLTGEEFEVEFSGEVFGGIE